MCVFFLFFWGGGSGAEWGVPDGEGWVGLVVDFNFNLIFDLPEICRFTSTLVMLNT